MLRRSPSIVVMLGLVVVASCSSSSDDGSGSPVDSGGDNATESTVDAATQAAIEAQLAQPPVDAVLGYRPADAISVPVTGATGGTATLTFPDGATATLDVPAGAVEQDIVLTLLPVSTIGDDGAPFTGVEILPAGLVFPTDAVPTITFAGAAADYAIAWDADERLEGSLALDNEDGTVTLPLFHTSGAGTGSGTPPLAGSEVDRVFAEVRRLLAAANEVGTPAAYEDARAEALTQLENLSKGYQRSALTIAARQCHQLGPVEDQVRIEYQAQLLGGSVASNADLVSKVIVRSADCALADCKNADDAAAGRFFEAYGLVLAGVGEVPAEKESEYSSAANDGRLLDCAYFQVTITGKGMYPAEPSVTEGFMARGVVMAGPDPAGLPLVAFSRGWEKYSEGLINGIGEIGEVYVGIDYPDGYVKCDPPTYTPGVVLTSVTTTPGLEEGSLVPVMRVQPFMPESLLVCNGQTDPSLVAITPMAIGVMALLPTMAFDGTSASHVFGETEEVGRWSWRARLSMDTAALGFAGTVDVDLQVRVTTGPPSPSRPADGMEDIFTVLNE